MPVKTISSPGEGRTFRLGRKRPIARGPRLSLKNYLLHSFPPPPASCDYTKAAENALSQMYLNDTLGCCLVGDTQVAAANILSGMRAHYSGPVITMVFRSGKQLTVTPNHAILTPRGFLPACLLKQGDEVVSSPFPEKMARGFQPDFDESPSAIEQKFSALSSLSDSYVRKTMPLSFNLDSDEQFINGDVDVVWPDRFLKSELNSTLGEPEGHEQISSSGELQCSLHGDSPFLQGVGAGRSAFLGGVRGGNDGINLGSAHPLVGEAQGVGLSSEWDPSIYERSSYPSPASIRKVLVDGGHRDAGLIPGNSCSDIRQRAGSAMPEYLASGLSSCYASDLKPSHESGPTDPHLYGNLRDTFPGLVESDSICKIYVDSFTGHVFDLGTESRLYSANGIITHNCVIACMAHVSGVLTGNAGIAPVLYTDDQVTRLYSAIGGYVPGDPSTDNGCVITDALAYWQQNGLLPDGSHKIEGYLAVSAHDQTEVLAAAYLFENLVFGVELPDAWVQNMPSGSGFVWDVAGDPDPQNGHCFMCPAYPHTTGVTINTWGMLGTLTYNAVSKYASSAAGGELYVVVSKDSLNSATQKSPTGMAWAQLAADFASIGGNVSLNRQNEEKLNV